MSFRRNIRSGGRRGTQLPTAEAPFSPLDLPDLEAWYRETYAAGTWSDLSGNGRDLTQGTVANQPTQVSRAGQLALSFDGGDFIRRTFGANQVQPQTIYAVVEPTVLAGATRVVFDSVGVTHRTQMFYVSTTSRQISAGTALSGAGGTLAIEALCALYNGVSSALYAPDDFVTALASGNAGANAMDGMTVGANITGGNFFTGYMWEIIRCSTVHDAATRKLVGDYLSSRYTGLSITT